ncbi:hypothetical protein [Italian clover phyllody phytoplasma]|uniref:hypothetical protein n=1 Tax=Italian clover phyllody phytoplasma TaxID=1196420 RepID=UPI00037BEB83|nr:hypothetical protein [Italian clover phyllody phytoplasma]
MHNNEASTSNNLSSFTDIRNNIENKIDENLSRSKYLSNKILQYDRLNLNTMNLKKQLKVLGIRIKRTLWTNRNI